MDSGYGLEDVAGPRRRVGPARLFVRPAFDADHIGGLSGFPHAAVHATAAEVLGSMISPSRRERVRYRSAQWAHGPRVVQHTPDGEKWRGFAAARELDAIASGIVLISLPGHTRGRACVAVEAGERWILHAGDAFCHRGTLDRTSPVPAALRAMEAVVAHDGRRVHDNHARLTGLHRREEPEQVIVNAHDPALWEQMRDRVQRWA
ncbi:MBL fold metallo-hydrolase [Streptomyces sp. NPDC001228]|uniref:MBL fold metallo-hydrolase n=1 Tax=Streptomyces sp. NPDC001228 TaxID=3154381 RepID=UPI0033323E1D